MTAIDLKSLAHPEWPYAGTGHAWRGFVQNGITRVAKIERGENPGAVYQRLNFGPDLN